MTKHLLGMLSQRYVVIELLRMRISNEVIDVFRKDTKVVINLVEELLCKLVRLLQFPLDLLEILQRLQKRVC